MAFFLIWILLIFVVNTLYFNCFVNQFLWKKKIIGCKKDHIKNFATLLTVNKNNSFIPHQSIFHTISHLRIPT